LSEKSSGNSFLQTLVKLTPDQVLYLTAIVIFFLKFQLRTRLLGWWDSAQFALALERYNIVEHRPHPPGYPLYILWGKIATYFTHDPNMSFILFGLVLSVIAAVLIKKFMDRLTGDTSVGWIAFALYSFAPLTFFHELKALTYVISAFFSILVAFEALRILNSDEPKAWRIALALGIMGMIRPYESILLLPLAIWVVWRLGMRSFLAASGIYIGLQIVWLIPVALMSGGFKAYFSELASEGGKHQRNIISLMDKPLGKTVKNLKSIYYYLRQSFPGWAFFAIVPVVEKILKPGEKSRNVVFFVLWLMPALILYSINYVNYAAIPIFISPAIAILIALGIKKSIQLFGSFKFKLGNFNAQPRNLLRLIAVIISLHLLVIFFSIDILFTNESNRKYDENAFNYDKLLASDSYSYMFKSSVLNLSEELGGSDKVVVLSDLNYRVLMYYLPAHVVLWTRYLSQKSAGASGVTKIALNRNDEEITLPSIDYDSKKYWVYELKKGEKAAVFTDEMLPAVVDKSHIRPLPGMKGAQAFIIDLENAWGIFFRYGEFGVLTKETAKKMQLDAK